ncbi:LCP family protein [Filobacillus milosensis]
MFFVFQYWEAKSESNADIEGRNDGNEEDRTGHGGDFDAEEPLDETINVLILGEDSDAQGGSRTDTIMIGQYDTEHDRAKLVSIMRDTYVEIPGHGHNKINAAYAFGGPELLRKTIKENFNIDINDYAIVDFRGFERIVDEIAPDGIEIDVEKRMYYTDEAAGLSINLEEGVQKLDGEELLGYARFRNDRESDFGRVRRQQQVMSALKEEMLSFASLLKIPKAIGTIEPYIETTMSRPDIVKFATDFLLNKPDEVETMRIPLDGTYSSKSYEHAGLALSINLSKNREAFQEFFTSQPKEDDETKQN